MELHGHQNKIRVEGTVFQNVYRCPNFCFMKFEKISSINTLKFVTGRTTTRLFFSSQPNGKIPPNNSGEKCPLSRANILFKCTEGFLKEIGSC